MTTIHPSDQDCASRESDSTPAAPAPRRAGAVLVGRDAVLGPREWTRGSATPAAPTERQVSYLRSLARDLGAEDPDLWVSSLREAAGPKWTRTFVSQAIDSAKKGVADLRAKQAATITPADAPARRTNRYGGKCHKCGNTVLADAGWLDKVNGSWIVSHRDGECGPIAERTTESTPSLTAESFPSVPDGHYAIRGSKHDLDFFRVKRPDEKSKWHGRLFVNQVIGGHPDAPVRAGAAIDVLRRIEAEGPAKAAQRYGRELEHCCVCNRHLTDENSREAGIGPECAGKGRW